MLKVIEQNNGQEERLQKSNVMLGSLEEDNASRLIDSTYSETFIHYKYYGNIYNQIASEQGFLPIISSFCFDHAINIKTRFIFPQA
jgi:hypothetical protein